MKTKQALILSLLITVLIANNIFFFSNFSKTEINQITVQRAIDGDTFVTTQGETIRLENINTPEKSEPGYEEAKYFLKQYENQTLQLETSQKDKYGRTLAKAFTPNYLNLEIVQNGLATKFLVENAEIQLFAQAEAQAIKQQKGLWKKSPYSECLQTQINPKKETILIENSCPDLNLQDWTIRDEGRNKYKFKVLSFIELNLHTGEGNDNQTDIFWNSKNEIWNNDRDTVYILDSENALAYYHTYGY
ncbi:MAG: thermonuclease family protein [Nanoarchaeota archaeon]|nr:thermonuclease family protein [Nanoarchaeota archaeon]MBU1051602.1 thermonuclease family protein [Nanoarchaeota archaeon]MBU1988038.1 thermonuclease family protein [Nanoarchaeota archaeon]